MIYLHQTRDWGLQYWRDVPRTDLPDLAPQAPISKTMTSYAIPTDAETDRIEGYCDSDWGTDRSHRRSVSGWFMLLAGAVILYKTKYQPTVAGSSTEAEFMTESDAGRSALYLRTILEEIGLPQYHPTSIYADNSGARQMMMAGRPTKRTRHIEIKYFTALHWVETDQIQFKPIPTALNPSDSLTKQTGRIKFYEHSDYYMGRTPPKYLRAKITINDNDESTIQIILKVNIYQDQPTQDSSKLKP